MLKQKTSSTINKIISVFLIYLLLFIPLNYYINVFLAEYLHSGLRVSAFSYSLAILIGFCSYFICFGRIRFVGYILFLFLLFGTIFYFILYPSNIKLVFTSFTDLAYNPFIILFAYCVPVFLLAFSGRINYKIFFKTFVFAGRIVVIILALFFFVLNIGWKRTGGQYMTTSYYALPLICALMLNHAKKKKIFTLDLLLSFLGIFMVTVGGSRGALICAVLFALLLIIISCLKGKKKIWVIALSVALLLFLFIGSESIFAAFKSFLISIGFNSRTLSKIEDSSFFVSNDRLNLWSSCINALFESPITMVFGYGLWGDRPIINSYSHNIVVELITSFGLFFGPIIFLFIIIKIIKAIIDSSKLSNDKHSIFLLAIPYGFFQLFFSDSLLLNVWFFLLVGLLFEKDILNKQISTKGYNYSNDILHTI